MKKIKEKLIVGRFKYDGKFYCLIHQELHADTKSFTVKFKNNNCTYVVINSQLSLKERRQELHRTVSRHKLMDITTKYKEVV